MTVYNLGTIEMNSGVADANGAVWWLTELDGWDGPDVRSEQLMLPAQDGVVTAEGMYGARILSLTGVCKTGSAGAFYASKYKLASETNVLSQWASTALYFSAEEDVERRCRVYRSSAIRTRGIGSSFEWQMQLRADDPIKYSAAANTEALVSGVPEELANDGSARTYPVITLTATGTPTISCETLEWRATGSMASGAVIDMEAKTVTTSGGGDLFDLFDLTSDWLYLAPGNNTVESNVACSVSWRDAWV